MKKRNNNYFIKLGIVTVAAVYFLILVGGIVRSTGSGMGCPDWPKCFGSWVPPTSVDQLPDNYQEVYSQIRHDKNLKFSKYLDWLGFADVAYQLRHDQSIREEGLFNVHKTWIEYVNRLVGVAIGFLIFSTFIASFIYYQRDNLLIILAFFSFLLVGFQGWVGSIVVSTNLLPWTITVHMLLAFLLIGVLIYIVFRASVQGMNTASINGAKSLNLTGLACIILFLLQIVIGTQVREEVDIVAASLNYSLRHEWIDGLGLAFYIHRSYSIVVLLVHIYFIYLLYKYGKAYANLLNLGRALAGLMAAAILTGVIMAYFSIPAFAQPIHLLLSSVIFGVQLLILFQVNYQTQTLVVKS
jgi:heme a synthase